MIELKCDICGLTITNPDGNYPRNIAEIRTNYRTKDITHICKDCDNEITEAQLRIKNVLESIEVPWIKKVMAKMKKEKSDG